jgi:hypothetical protein
MTRPVERVVLRLDGQYGTGAVLADLASFCYVIRGKDYTVLDRTEVQSRLHLPPDQQFGRPESDLVRTLYDCPGVPVGPTGQRCRVVVATHPANAQKSRIGLTRSGLVYELFFTALPQSAFTAADVVALYLHRGAYAPALADEDQEQDPDRWCSHSSGGKPAWQIISQWVWNLRLELGHQLEPTPMRTTEFAPASAEAAEYEASTFGYASPEAGLPWKAGRFSGRDFAPQADGTLRCPAGKSLTSCLYLVGTWLPRFDIYQGYSPAVWLRPYLSFLAASPAAWLPIPGFALSFLACLVLALRLPFIGAREQARVPVSRSLHLEAGQHASAARVASSSEAAAAHATKRGSRPLFACIGLLCHLAIGLSLFFTYTDTFTYDLTTGWQLLGEALLPFKKQLCMSCGSSLAGIINANIHVSVQ